MSVAHHQADDTLATNSGSKRTAMGRLPTIVTGLATAVAVFLVLISIDLSKILPTLRQLHVTTIAAVTILLLVNFVVAFFRFERTLSAFGAQVDRRTAAYAFSYGTLAGQFLLNVVGQSLTRALVMQSVGVPMSITVVATYIERLIALGTLAAITFIAVLSLFDTVGFESHEGGAYLLSLAIGLALTLGVAGVRAAASAITSGGLRKIVSVIPRLAPTLVLTILAHASMLAAYLALALDFSPGIEASRLVAAIVVVMFAAAMPISWAGWGLREFSAVYALNGVGVPGEAALVIAVTIGTLSLLIALAGASASMVDGWRRPSSRVIAENRSADSLVSANEVLLWPLGILVACLIFFQLRVPTGSGEIVLNVADPLAITAFFFATYMTWRDRLLEVFPISVARSVCALAAVLVLGAFVAWVHLGLAEWALLNRLLGFLILVGYLSVAALVVRITGERGRLVLADAFVTSALLICAIELAAYFIHVHVVSLPLDFFGYQFKTEHQLEGYAQNPNAFAFQILMAMCVLIAFRPLQLRQGAIPWSMLAVAAFLFVLVIVRSRAGIVCGLVVSASAISLHYTPTNFSISRTRMMILLIAAAIAGMCIFEFRASLAELIIEPLNERWRANADASDALRWQTTADAFRQWLRYPLFGEGLGSFLLERHRTGLSPLVIHSVPFWFLAEMGAIGLAGYIFFIATLLSWGMARIQGNGCARGVVICVTIFVLMGLVHDIFFQRTFWFVVGLMIANGFPQDVILRADPVANPA